MIPNNENSMGPDGNASMEEIGRDQSSYIKALEKSRFSLANMGSLGDSFTRVLQAFRPAQTHLLLVRVVLCMT